MLFSKIIKKKFDAVLGRYDGNPYQYYFKIEDFPKIKREEFDIIGDHNVKLKGYFYFKDQLEPNKLIVFDHGIGNGHEAYLSEIAYIVEHGYTVYSYDHSGCAQSEGSGILGFGQGVNDLDHVLNALKKDDRFKDYQFKLIGHSYGGYSAMNVLAFHNDVSHVVSLAGFISAKSLVEQYIPKMFLKYSKEVMARERQHNPQYADLDARDSILKSNAKVLYIQSKDDIKVKFELGYVPLYDALKNKDNVTFVSLDKRNHEPYHTDKACELDKVRLEEQDRLIKKHKLNTKQEQENFIKNHDWKAMNEEDPAIWNKIFEFLNS